jgi:hypothetical protein
VKTYRILTFLIKNSAVSQVRTIRHFHVVVEKQQAKANSEVLKAKETEMLMIHLSDALCWQTVQRAKTSANKTESPKIFLKVDQKVDQKNSYGVGISFGGSNA